MLEYKELLQLMKAATKANNSSAPVSYSYNGQNLSGEAINEALREELKGLCKTNADYRNNKNMIFSLIEETLDEVLPRKVTETYMQFAEVRSFAQGDKPRFTRKLNLSNSRAKQFVTRVGLAGRYEVFMLDGKSLEVGTAAIGGAARIGFEEMLDGRIQFSELTSLVMEGMDEFIYREIAKALEAVVKGLPRYQRAEVAGFDEATMDELLAIADTYGRASIYCTFEFAAKMLPQTNWVSDDMKNRLWADGWLGNYKGHNVIILPQSVVDETNMEKVIDPAQAYIMPVGQDNKPVKIVFEGPTAVRTVEDNDDWSTDFQTYKKFGVATFFTNYIFSYRNTNLVKNTRVHNLPVNPSIALDEDTLTVGAGNTDTLAATTVPAGETVTWTSSDTAVATVSNGTVTGVSAGTATITASITVNGTTYTDTCAVTVS